MRAHHRGRRSVERAGSALQRACAGLLSAAAIAAAIGCGSGLPLPPNGPHAGDEPKVVPYPPPAPKPEIIPKNELGENAVWVDGEWMWIGNRWSWRPGRWETPYPKTYFARSLGVRQADGTLLWFEGTWHEEADRRRTAAPKPATVAGPTAPMTSSGVPLPTLPPGSERIDRPTNAPPAPLQRTNPPAAGTPETGTTPGAGPTRGAGALDPETTPGPGTPAPPAAGSPPTPPAAGSPTPPGAGTPGAAPPAPPPAAPP
jgi:hypothetical protein